MSSVDQISNSVLLGAQALTNMVKTLQNATTINFTAASFSTLTVVTATVAFVSATTVTAFSFINKDNSIMTIPGGLQDFSGATTPPAITNAPTFAGTWKWIAITDGTSNLYIPSLHA